MSSKLKWVRRLNWQGSCRSRYLPPPFWYKNWPALQKQRENVGFFSKSACQKSLGRLLKAVKWFRKSEMSIIYHHKECEIMQKNQWHSSNGQHKCFTTWHLNHTVQMILVDPCMQQKRKRLFLPPPPHSEAILEIFNLLKLSNNAKKCGNMRKQWKLACPKIRFCRFIP